MAIIIIATVMPLYVVLSAGRSSLTSRWHSLFPRQFFAGYPAERRNVKADPRRNWYLLGALAAGFATLVKGPVGFLIPTLVLFVFHGAEGRRGAWEKYFATLNLVKVVKSPVSVFIPSRIFTVGFEGHRGVWKRFCCLPLNLLVFFGVTLPWFIGLSLQHPDFPYYGLVEESFHRFHEHDVSPDAAIFIFTLIVAGLFLPWSFILPEAGVAAWKKKSPCLPPTGSASSGR